MRAEVRLAWGSPAIRVGAILSQRGRSTVEYDETWLANGPVLNPLEPSPERLAPLRLGQNGTLLGLFGDAVPDGWGLRILHARARARGLDPATLSHAALLCLVGLNGPGALTYHPQTDPSNDDTPVDLDALQREADKLYTGTIQEVAEASRLAAGATGGARPKVLVDVLPDGTAFVGASAPLMGATSFLIKFPTRDEGRDYGRVELAYAAMARTAGIDMPPTRPFALQKGNLVCFGVERFDRPVDAPRPHILSLAGLLGADFRSDLIDYAQYLQAVHRVTQDHRAVLEGYRRLLFNVLAGNRDDHMKNFAFRLPHGGNWWLAPAFDLVPLESRAHITTVDGHETNIHREHTRRALGSVVHAAASALAAIEEEVDAAVRRWPEFAEQYEVPVSRVRRINRYLASLRKAFNA